MSNFNKVILLGNLVRKPEVRYTQGDNLPIARAALAVNRKYKDKEETMFIDIVVFGKLAGALEQYGDKGTPLLVEGRLQQNRWEKDGVKHSKHEVIVDSFQLMGKKDQAGATCSRPNVDEEDIPF